MSSPPVGVELLDTEIHFFRDLDVAHAVGGETGHGRKLPIPEHGRPRGTRAANAVGVRAVGIQAAVGTQALMNVPLGLNFWMRMFAWLTGSKFV